MRNTNLVFFSSTRDKNRKHQSAYLNEADLVITQCRKLLSETNDAEFKSLLNKIILQTTEVLNAKNKENIEEERYKLTQLALSLPEKLPVKNNLGSISTTLANICLFMLALSISIFLGYLFYAVYNLVSLGTIIDNLVWSCAADFIPFSLVGLFSYSVAYAFAEKTTTLDQLQGTINEFCAGELCTEESTPKLTAKCS